LFAFSAQLDECGNNDCFQPDGAHKLLHTFRRER
jgi:hypothetical protein